MQKYYLDFIDDSNNTERMRDDGIYTSYYLSEKVLIILLDIRTNRDDFRIDDPPFDTVGEK